MDSNCENNIKILVTEINSSFSVPISIRPKDVLKRRVLKGNPDIDVTFIASLNESNPILKAIELEIETLKILFSVIVSQAGLLTTPRSQFTALYLIKSYLPSATIIAANLGVQLPDSFCRVVTLVNTFIISPDTGGGGAMTRPEIELVLGVSDSNIIALSNLSNTNTGDQDISGKVDKITGKGLSTVDFTDTSYVHTDNNFTAALKNAYDGAVSWILTNGTNILANLFPGFDGSGSSTTASHSDHTHTGIYQPALIRRHAYSGGYDYNGHALFGSSEGASVWTITRILNNADGTTDGGKHCYTCSWTAYLTNIYA